MMDKTDKETAALGKAVKAMGEVIKDKIGFDTPPSQWSYEQVELLAEVASEAFIKEAGYSCLNDEIPF